MEPAPPPELSEIIALSHHSMDSFVPHNGSPSDSSPIRGGVSRKILINEMLSVDDAALTSHTAGALQPVITHSNEAGNNFGLIVTLEV